MNTMLVVTFAWSFALALFILHRLFRCKHKWELVDKTEVPSQLSELRKHAWVPQQMTPENYRGVSTIKILLCVRCPDCGAIKVIRESNE